MVYILDGYNFEQYYGMVNDGEVDWYEYATIVYGGYITMYQKGDKYCGLPIVHIYNHTIFDSVWMIVGSDNDGYFEVQINGYVQDCGTLDSLPFR